MKIALCVTTRNRPDAFNECMKWWETYKPKDIHLFVVDDASDDIYTLADFRFEKRVGIPAAKNKCFELAYNAGCDHIFLADDDVLPLVKDWHLPYINSGCAHLSYTFLPKKHSWGHFNIHTTPNGCLLYYTRKCLEVVGGMDTTYGIGKFEHPDLSRRIFNAGLTPFPYMDIKGSDKLFHSMDYHREIERSMTDKEQKEQFNKHIQYFNSKAKSKEYIDFRS